MIGGTGKRGSAAGTSKPPSSTATAAAAAAADDKASATSGASKNDDKKDETKGKTAHGRPKMEIDISKYRGFYKSAFFFFIQSHWHF